MNDELLNEIRTAYADTGPQETFDASHADRCLGYLSSDWLTPDDARTAVEYIGPYNAFEPATVKRMLDRIAGADPDALVAVGREGSPVLYVETDEPDSVEDIFSERWMNDDADSPWGLGGPDELMRVGPESVGSERKYAGDDIPYSAHSSCAHDEPPNRGHEAEPDASRSHVRAWWD